MNLRLNIFRNNTLKTKVIFVHVFLPLTENVAFNTMQKGNNNFNARAPKGPQHEVFCTGKTSNNLYILLVSRMPLFMNELISHISNRSRTCEKVTYTC